jgi:predicted DsbA family dithiol-disulfide isomerase
MQGEGIDKVKLGQSKAQKLGINGVPYFVVNERESLSGLRSPEEFIMALSDSSN